MTYRCNDCSYKNNSRFPEGRCPACGSYDISGGPQKQEEVKAPSPVRLLLLIALWSYLAFEIYRKL